MVEERHSGMACGDAGGSVWLRRGHGSLALGMGAILSRHCIPMLLLVLVL